MRVRISYGTDIKNVPEKMKDLIWNSREELQKTLSLLDRVCEDLDECEENLETILNLIDRSRKQLSACDLTLADVNSIASALNQYNNGEENVSERRSTVDSSGDTTTTPTYTGEG